MKFHIVWSDGSEIWVSLCDLKEVHPVEQAEFSATCIVDDKSVFAWWEMYTIKKKQVILSKVKACICKTTHKYGVEIPTSVKQVFELNKNNSNTLWCDVLSKEMINVEVSFEVLKQGRSSPFGWKKVHRSPHMGPQDGIYP